MTDNAHKLYVVTRRDLSPGQQAVQALHAAADHNRLHPIEAQRHARMSNTVVLLAARDERELAFYYYLASKYTKTTPFFEPDLDNSLTAFAAAPSPRHDIFAELPLALAPKKRWWQR